MKVSYWLLFKNVDHTFYYQQKEDESNSEVHYHKASLLFSGKGYHFKW